MSYSKNICALILVAACFCGGCNGTLSPQALEQLKQSYALYEAKDDDAAMRNLDAFLADNSNSARADEAYYLRGLIRYRNGDPNGAGQDLNAAIRRSGNKDLRVRARVAGGDIAYDGGDMALAENLYRQALEEIPQGAKPSDHARYRLGCVLQRQGRWEEADVQFDRVVHFFGDSEVGISAGRRTHSRAWTIQTGAFRKRTLAERMVKPLAAALKIRPVSVNAALDAGRPLFRVQVGRFATYEQAMGLLEAVREQQAGAFVDTTR